MFSHLKREKNEKTIMKLKMKKKKKTLYSLNPSVKVKFPRKQFNPAFFNAKYKGIPEKKSKPPPQPTINT
jgi:hypothetical protein